MKQKLTIRRKIKKYETNIYKAEITGTILSSIATTATSKTVALTGKGIPFSIPTAFATATIFRSSSETNSTKIRKKIIEYSQLYVLTREFNDKFYKFFVRSMKANEIENTEYKELVKIYEDHKK